MAEDVFQGNARGAHGTVGASRSHSSTTTGKDSRRGRYEMTTVYRELAKLYKRLKPRVVASLLPGDRVDTLAGQYEVFPVLIAKSGIAWMRRAESLIAPGQREMVSLDDLALAFEATEESLTEAQRQEDRESVRRTSSKRWVPYWERKS